MSAESVRVVAAGSDAASVVLNPAANRSAQKYSARELCMRVLWGLGKYAFRATPRPMFAWRRAILRAFGARVGHSAHIYASASIYMPWNIEIGDWAAIGENAFIYSLGKVRIGNGVTISYRAHICAGSHDFSDPALPLLKLPVNIEENAWIGTDAFVGPGVSIGSGAIVGARAVVVKDVQPLHIVGGNPAKQIGLRALRKQ